MQHILVLFSLALTLAAPGGLRASEKKDFAEAYKNKFFVVTRDGLQLAICSKEPGKSAYFDVTLTADGADTSQHGFVARAGESDCGPSPQPVAKGEVLRARNAWIRGGWLHIFVEAIAPHSVTRGVGAFEHESHELPGGILKLSVKDGYDQTRKLVDEWLHIFDSQDEAIKFGNTASGVFVKQVKQGMTFAEVESALGPPITRIDLENKVLYKYKDMTVEFHDGKVSDVR